jgi:transposase-like protein
MRIVELYRGGRSAPSISADFAVSEATIYRWILQDRIDHGEKPGLSSTENAELRSARARIRELEADLEITRKASALFDEEDPPAPKGSTR